ncbi:Ldh family oxidoreductase [Marinomonas arenicola]|uniref:Ldh family oxidoreductase n=1 Tax=Marinomonas arenicola TaxID=569601 RepID=A0ABU9G284_9GAMM
MADEKVLITLNEIEDKTKQALVSHGAAPWVATEVAKAVRQAEAEGNLICGLFYLDSYCVQLTTGRVNGTVEPVVSQPKGSAIQVDAKLGFAQAAFSRGFDKAVEIAKLNGTASLAISHSHTCTSMGYFTEQIAKAGLIGIGMTNAPACVSPPGASKAVLGTNPISMAVPAKNGGVAFKFDQSTSAIAIGKIRIAAAAGEKIPYGWAVDKNGEPTDDPVAGLEGSLVSAGGYKGYGFGLMAEILAAAVTGSNSSVNAPALKAAEGDAHDLGQFYFLIDPTVYSGDVFWERLASLEQSVNSQPQARLPGAKQNKLTEVLISKALWDSVLKNIK